MIWNERADRQAVARMAIHLPLSAFESPSTLHLLPRPDPGRRRVLRGIPLCRGRRPTFRARVPDWICGGHADYLQLCAVNLGLSRRYGKSTEYLHGREWAAQFHRRLKLGSVD